MNKTIVLQKRYDRLISFIKVLSIPAAVIFIGLVASLYWFYKNLSPQNFGPEWLAVLVAGAILALGVFHLILLLALWISSRTSETPNIARSLAIALGCVSAVSLAVSAVALSDIGKQTAAGFDSSGEWTILLINNIIQFLFLVFALSSLPVFKKKSAAPFYNKRRHAVYHNKRSRMFKRADGSLRYRVRPYLSCVAAIQGSGHRALHCDITGSVGAYADRLVYIPPQKDIQLVG